MGECAPIIAFVVAMDECGVIGRDDGLPWRLASDLKMFRRLTMGKPLIMGRRTFVSIGRPLDGRDNIVLTRDRSFSHPGVLTAHNPEAALSIAQRCARKRGTGEIMVIGGAEIYRQFLPRASRIYLTRVHTHASGNAVFPALREDEWREAWREHHRAGKGDDHDYTFVVLERRADDRALPPGRAS